MNQIQTRRFVVWAAVLVVVALGATVWPFDSRSQAPPSTVPLSFLDFQRAVVGVVILLGLAPAAGVASHLLSGTRFGAASIALVVFALSVTLYARWWFQPIVFLHGVPLPAMENIALWLAVAGVAYGVAGFVTKMVADGRATRLTTILGCYSVVLALGTVTVLAPLAATDMAAAPRTLAGGYGIAWDKPFALPPYDISEWVLEAGPAATPGSSAGHGRLYVVAGTDALRIDLATGNEDWRTPLGLEVSGNYAIGPLITLRVLGGSLYAICRGQRALVVRLDKDTGALIWATPIPVRQMEWNTGRDVQFTQHHILMLPGPGERGPFCYYAVETETGQMTAVDVLPDGYTVGFEHTSSPFAWVTGPDGALALRLLAYPPGFIPEMTWSASWRWSDHGWLVGISPETARPSWRVQGIGGLDPAAPVGVAIDQNGWVARRVSPDGDVPEYVCHSLPDGKLRWRVQGQGSYGSIWLLPEIALIADHGEGITLRGVARGSGQEMLQRTLPPEDWFLVQPVLVTDETIALNCGHRVIVLDRHDGSTVWERAMPESRGPADRVSITALYPESPGGAGPVLVLREGRPGSRSGRAVAVSAKTGEPVALPGYEDTATLVADGYLLELVGEESVRSWHPVLRGRTQQVKLRGVATRVKVRYAEAETSRPIRWGEGGMLVFPFNAEEAWGSVGLSPYTGAYEVAEDVVVRSFGGQLLTLAQGDAWDRCWIVALARVR